MENTRYAMIISAAATLVLFGLALANYIITGMWDAHLSSLIACNACICCCASEKVRRAKTAASAA